MKVKSVRRITLDTPVPVYDLTVDGPENFKLAHGPFVHNSKDVADALAGVVYGCTMRREFWALHGIAAVALPRIVLDAVAKEKADKFKKTV